MLYGRLCYCYRMTERPPLNHAHSDMAGWKVREHDHDGTMPPHFHHTAVGLDEQSYQVQVSYFIGNGVQVFTGTPEVTL